jgi:hypothetical protein
MATRKESGLLTTEEILQAKAEADANERNAAAGRLEAEAKHKAEKQALRKAKDAREIKKAELLHKRNRLKAHKSLLAGGLFAKSVKHQPAPKGGIDTWEVQREFWEDYWEERFLRQQRASKPGSYEDYDDGVVKEAQKLLIQQEDEGNEPDTDVVLAIAQENMERRLTTTGMAGKSAIVKVAPLIPLSL